ncbi:MAG: hypothetical protein AAGB93_06455 [Planctomycetota bacterium]
MSPVPLAIFGSIHLVEILVIGGAALMIFGPRLPEVALRATAHVMRARRAVSKMWRDTGLEEELRRVRRDIELSVPRDADFDVRGPATQPLAASGTAASPEALAQLDDVEDVDSLDPDAEREGEASALDTTIEPAEGIVAAGDLAPDADADRREPSGGDLSGDADDGSDGGQEVEPDSELEREPPRSSD